MKDEYIHQPHLACKSPLMNPCRLICAGRVSKCSQQKRPVPSHNNSHRTSSAKKHDGSNNSNPYSTEQWPARYGQQKQCTALTNKAGRDDPEAVANLATAKASSAPVPN
eukprot:scaffold2190_cov30-Prasinocladus_malaysianus.AAC.2